ncbi:hypothetical protein CMQ_6686 [Grosmannia clavigera kw1407]|uniref:Uncharacterized protein n=1 Tax=Grosmannia clavigera (strain kw1407 / UAMH 11150) TaxID=655863 RepID=F0X7I2_GROCL|nr:uncharacterized protein CMQ_6686 [Grosmannia clavigera kw1407]EFX06365.1 hypothetical protein CMQ_6686 [Grosmannia clavigera kw1407]
MIQEVASNLADTLRRHGWASELAGILPLSALIDFVAIPPKLHVLELSGAVPLWSWVITPAGSRVLLARRPQFASPGCCQDRFGTTIALETLDGRYGERYFASNPETLRLVLAAHPIIQIENRHDNMTTGLGSDLRIQALEVVHITRRDPNHCPLPSSSIWRRIFVNFLRNASSSYLAIALLGWGLLICTVVASFILEAWIALAFLSLIPVTGVVIVALYGRQPRQLLVGKPSIFNRLLVVSEHMNSTDWLVVYGESTVVNSLLNRPLEPTGPPLSPAVIEAFYWLLHIFIMGQWALALGAAVTKNSNAYIICFWIAFSIFSHVYLVTPEKGVRDWSKGYANLRVKRYGIKVSSRRALLNTIVALNPDTFSVDEAGTPDMTSFHSEGIKWIDPVLTRSDSRTMWEKATREAMTEAQLQIAAVDISYAWTRDWAKDMTSMVNAIPMSRWMEYGGKSGVKIRTQLLAMMSPPITDKVKNVLDIGTGTGTWAIATELHWNVCILRRLDTVVSLYRYTHDLPDPEGSDAVVAATGDTLVAQVLTASTTGSGAGHWYTMSRVSLWQCGGSVGTATKQAARNIALAMEFAVTHTGQAARRDVYLRRPSRHELYGRPLQQ